MVKYASIRQLGHSQRWEHGIFMVSYTMREALARILCNDLETLHGTSRGSDHCWGILETCLRNATRKAFCI